MELNRTWNSPVHQIRTNDRDGRGQVPQLLLVAVRRLEAELGERCGNIHEPSDKGYDATHLCGVLRRIIGAAQDAAQRGCSEHGQLGDLLSPSRPLQDSLPCNTSSKLWTATTVPRWAERSRLRASSAQMPAPPPRLPQLRPLPPMQAKACLPHWFRRIYDGPTMEHRPEIMMAKCDGRAVILHRAEHIKGQNERTDDPKKMQGGNTDHQPG